VSPPSPGPGPRFGLRVGQGFDVHPWSEDETRTLVLGGVPVPGHRALRGHSDADVVAHACTDAILGGAGLGDIGQLFPDTDPTLAGADSLALLAEAVDAVRRSGWTVVNVDCTLVLDRPRIAPLRDEMERNLGRVVGAPVTVKGKRTEGLASLGEGAHCWAVALLSTDAVVDAEPSGPGSTEVGV
jgi:2-C-methyl-D-erythritol 2,4-cyclodiphosphate synthase